MTNQKIITDLPNIYSKFFPTLFEQSIPKEILADCNDCAMCVEENERQLSSQNYYSPEIKCCTYHPRLYNYLIGGLLLDETPAMDEGRYRILDKIRNKIGITPYGIFPSKKYFLLYKEGRKVAFGKSKLLLCPYYLSESQKCSLWKFREAVCSTFFCKHIAGEDSMNFWESLKRYLVYIEDTLTKYVLFKMDLDAEKILSYSEQDKNIKFTSYEDLDELPPTPKKYKNIWGDWVGKEIEFYKQAFQIVSNLTYEDFEKITGIHQLILLEKLKKTHTTVINPNIPNILKRNPRLIVRLTKDNSYIISIAKNNNIFNISPTLYQIIHLFNGYRTNEEVLQFIKEEHNILLEEELLLSLYQNRTLIGCDADSE